MLSMIVARASTPGDLVKGRRSYVFETRSRGAYKGYSALQCSGREFSVQNVCYTDVFKGLH